jgi:hypothetical protein
MNSPHFKASLLDLKKTGANFVSFIIPYHQSDKTSSYIFAGGDTPSDDTLRSAINYAHSIGLKVMLKPHLASDDGVWRAHIDATDRNAWFASYGNMLNHLADIAQETKAEQICLGTELISMSTYTSNPTNTEAWIKMISDVRARYSGKLTYSANWGGNYFTEEAEHIGFWPHLDYIGVSAYYQLATEKYNPQVRDFLSTWKYWDDTKISPLYKKFKKPIIFTEVGYRSVIGANTDPYNGDRKGGLDLELQARLFQALFQYWNAKPYMVGIHIWNWNLDPFDGGPGNTQYTVQHKPAEEVLRQWFINNGLAKKTVAKTSIGELVAVSVPFNAQGKLTRGSHVFKASLLTRSHYEYVISWSVDGGDPVWMSDSSEDLLNEIDVVDTTSWNWRGNGPYKVTFIAREFSGKILGQKSVDVYLK